HADFGILDQSGRALVCRAHQKAAPTRCSYLGEAAASRHPRLHYPPQPRPQALQMDQVRRPNPRLGQALLPEDTTDFMRRTLDSGDYTPTPTPAHAGRSRYWEIQ